MLTLKLLTVISIITFAASRTVGKLLLIFLRICKKLNFCVVTKHVFLNFLINIEFEKGPQMVDSKIQNLVQSKQEDDEGVIVDPIIAVSNIQVFYLLLIREKNAFIKHFSLRSFRCMK